MFVVIWEYRVRAHALDAFAAAYGRGGAWVRLFATDDGYVTTELLQDPDDERTFLTIDRWSSVDAYEAFRAANVERYAAIDRECGELTESEHCVGTYVVRD